MSARGGDELIELLLAEEMNTDEAGEAANDLLKEILRGYPAQNLNRLIHSENKRAVDTGAFVISELGARAAEVIYEVDFLLGHPSWRARFDALDAPLVAASSAEGAILAKAVALVADPERAVRWKALHFLEKATPDRLAAAVPYIGDGDMADLALWLGTDGSDPAHLPEILNSLRAHDKKTRMFGAAAAARVAAADRRGIEEAAASEDADVRSFAESVLRQLHLAEEIHTRQEQGRRERADRNRGP